MYDNLFELIPWDFAPHLIFILKGVFVTLSFSLTAVFFGFVIATLLAVCKIVNSKYLRFFAHAYTSIFRGTPLMIQLMIIHYGMPLLGINITAFVSGVTALSLNSGAYVSEVIRSGIESVDKGQSEAAKALGISPILCMKDIILPQAFCRIMPALVNELIDLVKESALVSLIGGMDLMRRAQVVSAESFTFFTPMLTAAFAYYFLVLVISSIAMILEKRMSL